MKTLILCVFLLQNLTFGEASPASAPGTGDPFIHSVYFWLNDHLPDSERMAFKTTLQSFKKIKGVKKLYVLEPAGTKRDVVDNSYDYALIIHFKDEAAQQAYQADPLHLKAVKKMQPMIRKFIVYDAE